MIHVVKNFVIFVSISCPFSNFSCSSILTVDSLRYKIARTVATNIHARRAAQRILALVRLAGNLLNDDKSMQVVAVVAEFRVVMWLKGGDGEVVF